MSELQSHLARKLNIHCAVDGRAATARRAAKLTLVFPPAEDHIVELLLNADPPLSGFTTSKAEGHGHDFGNASVRERVLGRVARGVLVLILIRSRLSSVLEDIRLSAGIPNLTYWTEPIECRSPLGGMRRILCPWHPSLPRTPAK